MKNTLSLIGAIAVGIGMIVASAIIVKKYFDKKSENKEEDTNAKCKCDVSEDDDFNWEDIPVEEDEDDGVAESIKELNNLDSDEN